MGRPLIVVGDKTSHGGTVVEGTPGTDIDGKLIACVGHKVTCPIPWHRNPSIATGDNTLIIDGKPAARHADKTTCGATLISSQIATNSDPEGGETDESNTGTKQPGAAMLATVVTSIKPELPYDEQLKILGPDTASHEGLPYRIETTDGRVFTGTLPASGQLPRICTESEDTYHVYWGDEALAKDEAL